MTEGPTRLAHYEILEQIGQGGMGEVYRARDTKLERDVALKILPASVADQPDRLHRFEQEARAAGALNHPNIVTIYELGTHEETGAPYIVMELVEGETLREKLGGYAGTLPSAGSSPSGPGGGGTSVAASSIGGSTIPLRKVVDYGIQIAHGLAAAHDKGIAHRDLKPENVLVTPQGQAKILDFGLAKLTEATADGDSMTRTAAQRTAPGAVLGTVGYMSPEQVRGREVDHRTDIFSLGAMLYEMLSGRRAFQSGSSVETMNAILTEDPASLSGEHSRVPGALDRIVRRCMEKEPEQRFQSGHDLAFALEAVGETSSTSGVAVRLDAPRATRRVPIVLALVAALALSVVGFLAGRSLSSGTGTSGGTLPPSRLSQLTFDDGPETQPSIAPDGKSFAYVSSRDGDADIYFQRVGGETAINLTADSPEDDSQPAFSPDGERIAFRSERDGGGIFVMGATGESVRRLTEFGFNPAWSPDGSTLLVGTESIVVPTGRGSISELWRIDVTSGATEKLETADAVQPSWSPDGARIAYWGLPEGTGKRVLYTSRSLGGEVVALTDDDFFNWNPLWSRDGRHLYFSSNRSGTMNIWRLPMDPRTGRASGPPQPLTASTEWSGPLAVSWETDRLVFESAKSAYSVERWPIDPATLRVRGEPERLRSGSRETWEVRPSPDGKRLVIKSLDPWEDLFVADAEGKGLRRLTSDGSKDRNTYWAPDSETIYFLSDRSGGYQIWRVRADGSGLTQVTDKTPANDPIISPDGRWLAMLASPEEGVTLLDLEQPLPLREGTRLPKMEAKRFFVSSSWSPDGTRLVGTGIINDRGGIPDGLWTYTFATKAYDKLTDEGFNPIWFPDGQHILYAAPAGYKILDSATGEAADVFPTNPRFLFNDVRPSPDGRWLYVSRVDPQADIWMLSFDEDVE